ncbi:MAG: Ig-like domain-containing protein [Mobilitalea sp.]
MKKLLSAILIFVLILSIISPTQVYAAVKISKAKATMEVDSYLLLKITDTKTKITWSSSDKTIASIDKNGLVTAISDGKCTITAKVGKSKYTCVITVVDSNPAILSCH